MKSKGGKIEAILVDIDGCLLSTKGEISGDYYVGLIHFSQYVKKANEERFPAIRFCTGRDRNYVEAVSFVVGLPNSYSVIESGIALFNPTTKEMLFNPALTAETREAFEEISRQRIPQILKRYPALFLYPGNMINVALECKHQSNLSIEEAYKGVEEEMKDLLGAGLITMHHSDIAIDISPAGIDKASGVRFLTQYAGLELNRILGIGDSNGDFPMLELVGYVGSPANAGEECKELIRKRGGYLSPYLYAAGVADIIDHFIKEGNQ